MTFGYLRHLLTAKPVSVSYCVTLVPDLELDADVARRCSALIHAVARGERGAAQLLRGLLNREEDALKARLGGKVLRASTAALPGWLQGKMPNLDARTFNGSEGRKAGSHRSR